MKLYILSCCYLLLVNVAWKIEFWGDASFTNFLMFSLFRPFSFSLAGGSPSPTAGKARILRVEMIYSQILFGTGDGSS